MSHLNDNKDDDGIRVNAPKDRDFDEEKRLKEIEALGRPGQGPAPDHESKQISQLEAQIKRKDDAIVQLTAMCYTLARRLRNESFNDTITSVQRQQMAEMAMNSLNMTPDVWVLVHRSEEQQQQNNSQ